MRNMRYRLVVATLIVLLLACEPQPQADLGRLHGSDSASWRDPSSHSRTFIVVAPGVRVEVLDWGGTGRPLLFLAGLGNSAHIFDDFAPQFTDEYHVFAMTRRGYGASSQPSAGYDIGTRVNDLVAVLNSLRLDRVSLIGHSIAGDELTSLAARYPARIDRLIYLDAAYDHSVLADMPPEPSDPPMSTTDASSPSALRAFYASYWLAMPEAEIRATAVFSASGRYERDVTPAVIAKKVLRGVGHPEYKKVSGPALAMYKTWDSPQQALTQEWWDRMDTRVREAATTWWRAVAAWSTAERARFQREVPTGQTIALTGAHHYLFVSHEVEVRTAIRRFLVQ
jgi:non-heme chloroperoxidase